MARVDMVMPQMGESIAEGTIIRWLKKEGERVERDEIILEISTDKVDSEIPSPEEGIVAALLAGEGDTVTVGSVIAQIETAAQEPTATPEPATQSPVDVAAPIDVPEPAPSAPVIDAPAPAATQGGVLDIVMPQMGESITEGTVIRWLKKEGERVERDEILLEISTDKVDSEIPSPHAGVLQAILIQEGATVEVGAVIARIGAESMQRETVSAAQPVATAVAESSPTPVSATQANSGAQASSPEPSSPVAAATGNGARRFYSPLVRRIARVEGISSDDLGLIAGTGANDRVTKRDILNYLDTRSTAGVSTTVPAAAVSPPAPATRPAQVSAPAADGERVERIPMDTMRKSIAKHMLASVQTSPHVFAVSEADMTNLVTFRAQNKERFLQDTGTKLTYMPFITMACARALQDFPLVNASVDGDTIVRKKDINVGLAVALENNGLIVPVVKHADGLNVVGMARSINDLAARARNKKLLPDEVQGGTFSITNMGSFGSLMGLPIINQPQVAILGVGTIQKRPVVINDAIAIRSMMYVSLSFDHRLVDGGMAGQFLDRVAQNLTNFDTANIL